jgi:hypothetical protein
VVSRPCVRVLLDSRQTWPSAARAHVCLGPVALGHITGRDAAFQVAIEGNRTTLHSKVFTKDRSHCTVLACGHKWQGQEHVHNARSGEQRQAAASSSPDPRHACCAGRLCPIELTWQGVVMVRCHSGRRHIVRVMFQSFTYINILRA